MKVEDCKYVSLKYTLSVGGGEAGHASAVEEPLEFLVGADQIIPGLERALLGMEPGEKRSIRLEAADAYGERRSDLLRDIPRENFPPDVDLEVGMGFEANGPHGPVVFRIHSVSEENVLADFNHPLAGESLLFDVSIEDVREPTAEELQGAEAPSCSSGCSSCGGSCG